MKYTTCQTDKSIDKEAAGPLQNLYRRFDAAEAASLVARLRLAHSVCS